MSSYYHYTVVEKCFFSSYRSSWLIVNWLFKKLFLLGQQIDADFPPLKGPFSSLLEDSNEEDKNGSVSKSENDPGKGSIAIGLSQPIDPEKFQNIPVTINQQVKQHENQNTNRNQNGSNEKHSANPMSTETVSYTHLTLPTTPYV